MRSKDIVNTLTKQNTHTFNTNKIDRKIEKLRYKKSEEQITNALHNADKKYVIVLGQQIDTDLFILWGKNRDNHDAFEIADDYLESVIKNDDPVYNFVLSRKDLLNLYRSIADRKLRHVAREATQTLHEFIMRVINEEKKINHE